MRVQWGLRECSRATMLTIHFDCGNHTPYVHQRDLNLSQFVDETVIDELEREGFFESLKKK